MTRPQSLDHRRDDLYRGRDRDHVAAVIESRHDHDATAAIENAAVVAIDPDVAAEIGIDDVAAGIGTDVVAEVSATDGDKPRVPVLCPCLYLCHGLDHDLCRRDVAAAIDASEEAGNADACRACDGVAEVRRGIEVAEIDHATADRVRHGEADVRPASSANGCSTGVIGRLGAVRHRARHRREVADHGGQVRREARTCVDHSCRCRRGVAACGHDMPLGFL